MEVAELIVSGHALSARSVPVFAADDTGRSWHVMRGRQPGFVEITREAPRVFRDREDFGSSDLRLDVFIGDIPLAVDGWLTGDNGTDMPMVWEVTLP